MLLDHPNAIYRIREILKLTGVSKALIYSLMAEGSFPKNIRLGKRAVGWLKSEVDEWLANRVLTRGAKLG